MAKKKTARKNDVGDVPAADAANAESVAAGLRGLYELADLTPPAGIGMSVPTLYYGLPDDEMANQIGDHLRSKNILFVRDDTVGTVDLDGRWRPMDTDRFRTWLPDVGGMIPFQKFHKDTGKPVKAAIKVESARAVLASDQLRGKLPKLERINLVRMPVFREALDERGSEKRAGFRKMELLPFGYDSETKTYTVRVAGADFDENADANEAVKFFRHLLRYFDMDDRSRAVQMSSMLTVFGAGLFHCPWIQRGGKRGSIRGRSPLFVWNSPHGGSGKSRLAQISAESVYPDIGRAGYHWRDPGETRKEMDSAQQAGSPILWFDDVTLPPGMEFRNTDINRWLTGKTWQCRVMSTQQLYAGPLTAATFLTGTHLELDEQLFRRSLYVDLFPRMKARDRKLPKDAILLDDDFFENGERRSQILAGLWAMCRWWDENDRVPGPSRPLESFENWSRTIPAIVSASGFADALAPFEAPDAGDRASREMKALVRALVMEYAPAAAPGETGIDRFEVSMKQVVRTARMNGLFVDTLLSVDDIFARLSGSRGHEWSEVPDVEANRDLVEAGGDALDAVMTRPPTDEEKRLQAAEWTDHSIGAKWGKEFRSAAVTGQWFAVDDAIWQFGDRRDYRGSRFVVQRLKGAEGGGE